MIARLLLVALLLVAAPAWGAITFVGGAHNSSADGADITVTLPGGVQQNDLVIVAYGLADNTNTDLTMAILTSGYTAVPGGTDLFCNDTNDGNLGVFYKFMDASPDASVQVDGDGVAGNGIAAVAMVFRGVHTTTPFDVNAAVATGLDTMHPNPPSLTHAGSWTVIAAMSSHGQGAQTYTFPSGYTTNARDVTGNGSQDATVGMGYRTSPANPEDPGVMTLSGTDSGGYCWAAVTMALRAAVSGAGALIDRQPINSLVNGGLTR